MVTAPFEALIPSILVLLAFMLVDQGVTAAFGVNLPQAIMNLFTPFAKAVDSVGGMMAIQFLINFLWFFGIYGSAVPDSVTAGFFMTNITANAAAYAAGRTSSRHRDGSVPRGLRQHWRLRFRPSAGNLYPVGMQVQPDENRG